MNPFTLKLIAWQRTHGRHDLPWQNTRDPYAIWVSEIMLQQTQVATVIPYYQRFMARFPALADLADATEDEVLALWSGLGYYSRGRNLHRAARLVVECHNGPFPRDPDLIAELPGIGRSTAAAVAAFAFGARLAILDGNVKRVLTRCFGIEGYPGDRTVEKALWQQAESLLPKDGIEAYTQGLMDLGATLCTRAKPRCEECPMEGSCFARRTDRVKDFPGPKPRKALPEKATAMALMICDGEIFLEKRPPTGIWGGLWSLPELSADSPAEKSAAERYGVVVKSCLPLPTFTHTFSHFRLHIAPWLMTVRPDGKRAAEPGGLWLNLEEARGAALPAPVKKLISAIQEKP